MEVFGNLLQSVGSKCYVLDMASTTRQRDPLGTRRPKDKKAAAKLEALMANTGLSPEVLGAQTGVSGKRIRQILDDHVVPQRRIRYALSRRFELLPSDVWQCDATATKVLGPDAVEHLRQLAKRTETPA